MEKKVRTTISIETEDESIAGKILEAINKGLYTYELEKIQLTYNAVQYYVEEEKTTDHVNVVKLLKD